VACNAIRFPTSDPVQIIYYEKNPEDGLSGLIGLVNSGQSDTYDFHKLFDEPLLNATLEEVGFRSIRLWDWRKIDHLVYDDLSQVHLPHMKNYKNTLVSLNLEALK